MIEFWNIIESRVVERTMRMILMSTFVLKARGDFFDLIVLGVGESGEVSSSLLKGDGLILSCSSMISSWLNSIINIKKV